MSRWRTKLFSTLESNSGVIRDISSNRDMAFSQILRASLNFGRTLNHPKGTVLSVVLPNSHEYLVAYLTATLYGYVFAPIPYFLSHKEVEKTLDYHGDSVLITDRTDLHSLRAPITVDTSSLESNFDSLDRYELPEIRENDWLCLYYSSGTTGEPKGVLYSHENKFELIKSIVEDFKFTRTERHFVVLPFGHTASLNYSVFPSFYMGTEFSFVSSFEKIRSRFFHLLESERSTYVQIVPTIAHTLLKLKESVRELDLSHLPYVGCGSAPLSVSAQNQFEELFGIRLANLYGLSETGPTHFDDPTTPDWKPGSIGRPLSVNECVISDNGEILIRGKNVFSGYYKNQELTHDSIKNGWFQTGDYGLVENGRYFFRDRKKDLIIIGGINVFPAEIEEVLYRHKSVQNCVVFGTPDTVQGERILACIELKGVTHEITSQLQSELYLLCKENLSTFKVPSSIYFTAEIPKTASGKLLRRAVRDEYLRISTNIE